MSEDNKNIKQYSSADIQKYLQGKLSAAEMYAMEKAAMGDPFLADAIEGMQNNFEDETTFNNDIEDLKKRLAERIEEKNKIIPISLNRLWWRVAATVAVLLGAAALMYNYFNKGSFSKQNIAATNHEIAIDSTARQNKLIPEASQSNTFKKQTITIAENKKIAVTKNSRRFTLQKSKSKKNNNVSEDASAGIAVLKNAEPQKEYDKTVEAKDSTIHNINTSKPLAANASVQLKTDSLEGKVAGLNIQNDKLLYNNSFQGKVVDANMQPVIGANVLLENKKIGVTTDNNGFFNINTNKNDSVINVYVNSIGYNNTSAILKNNNDLAKNTIQLQPNSNALSEVVVTALGVQKKQDNEDEETTIAPGESREKKPAVQKAIPAIGWEQYNNYIDSNKKITTADSTIKGKEIISFIINKKGEVSSFKIIQSLSSAHDTESIRLVKQGPAWKLLKGKKTRATLTIQF